MPYNTVLKRLLLLPKHHPIPSPTCVDTENRVSSSGVVRPRVLTKLHCAFKRPEVRAFTKGGALECWHFL